MAAHTSGADEQAEAETDEAGGHGEDADGRGADRVDGLHEQRQVHQGRGGGDQRSAQRACGDACPVFPGKRYLDWHLTDPAGKTPAEIRPIRDDIHARVRALLAEIVLT
ncbi:hypothetical protein [Pseudonocardia abyssalis]|uniref:hypothetical protein n=1 Tax=Pseudonocardia abyssalis TaxID=2792008 RepID=UPI001CF6E6BD|nr:hypothetical protein [Pseudonocardia abyssalis]